MVYIDFISGLHKRTMRDYLSRVTKDKPLINIEAKKYDYQYWDGNRRYGYGGFKYDGRWREVAKNLIDHYNLTSQSSVLDVGCGKGFLLYDIFEMLPGITIKGLDISNYAIEHCKSEIKSKVDVGKAECLPFANNTFDLIISINTLHNLYVYDLKKAIQEIERVGKKNKYIVVEAYRTEKEKFNMMCWVLTGECFFSAQEWEWLLGDFEYTGDHSFIYFE